MMLPYRTAWNVLQNMYIGLITKISHMHFILPLKNCIKETPQRLPLKISVMPLGKVLGSQVSLEFQAY